MKFLGNIQDELIKNNRKKFFAKINIKENNIISAGLSHQDNIKIISQKDKGKIIKNCDGLVTIEKNLILTVTVADCLPIFIYDREKKIAGIIHASWRNLRLNILSQAVELLKNKYKINPKNLLVHIGPYISKCHFEVKNDVANKFKKYKNAIIIKDKKIFIDLAEIARGQLIRGDIIKKNIKISKECTYHQKNKYFSHRREKTKDIKAMIAYIGLK